MPSSLLNLFNDLRTIIKLLQSFPQETFTLRLESLTQTFSISQPTDLNQPLESIFNQLPQIQKTYFQGKDFSQEKTRQITLAYLNQQIQALAQQPVTLSPEKLEELKAQYQQHQQELQKQNKTPSFSLQDLVQQAQRYHFARLAIKEALIKQGFPPTLAEEYSFQIIARIKYFQPEIFQLDDHSFSIEIQKTIRQLIPQINFQQAQKISSNPNIKKLKIPPLDIPSPVKQAINTLPLEIAQKFNQEQLHSPQFQAWLEALAEQFQTQPSTILHLVSGQPPTPQSRQIILNLDNQAKNQQLYLNSPSQQLDQTAWHNHQVIKGRPLRLPDLGQKQLAKNLFTKTATKLVAWSAQNTAAKGIKGFVAKGITKFAATKIGGQLLGAAAAQVIPVAGQAIGILMVADTVAQVAGIEGGLKGIVKNLFSGKNLVRIGGAVAGLLYLPGMLLKGLISSLGSAVTGGAVLGGLGGLAVGGIQGAAIGTVAGGAAGGAVAAAGGPGAVVSSAAAIAETGLTGLTSISASTIPTLGIITVASGTIFAATIINQQIVDSALMVPVEGINVIGGIKSNQPIVTDGDVSIENICNISSVHAAAQMQCDLYQQCNLGVVNKNNVNSILTNCWSWLNRYPQDVIQYSANNHAYLQCVGFAVAASHQQGINLPAGIGHAYSYATPPDGCQSVNRSNIKIGNLAVWNTAPYGHIAVITKFIPGQSGEISSIWVTQALGDNGTVSSWVVPVENPTTILECNSL